MSSPYSYADSVAPYLGYDCVVRLLVDVGGVQMALAYKNTPGSVNPTSRLLQAFEPTAAIVVEWSGKRQGAKPQPPQVLTAGTFVLHSAGGQCSSPSLGTNAQFYLEASGYLVMLSATRPELLVIPAFWTPYESGYEEGTTPYTYTPQELGFGNLLPGQPGATGNPAQFRKPNNPPGNPPVTLL
jgi:hypothetical protein